MLTSEDNELLCRVGSGTPMGDLIRQYWIPALLTSELPEPDGPVRVGEPAPAAPRPARARATDARGWHADRKQIVEFRGKILRHETVSCPNDGAPFRVLDVTTYGSVGSDFAVHCPECGALHSLPSGRRR